MSKPEKLDPVLNNLKNVQRCINISLSLLILFSFILPFASAHNILRGSGLHISVDRPRRGLPQLLQEYENCRRLHPQSKMSNTNDTQPPVGRTSSVPRALMAPAPAIFWEVQNLADHPSSQAKGSRTRQIARRDTDDTHKFLFGPEVTTNYFLEHSKITYPPNTVTTTPFGDNEDKFLEQPWEPHRPFNHVNYLLECYEPPVVDGKPLLTKEEMSLRVYHSEIELRMDIYRTADTPVFKQFSEMLKYPMNPSFKLELQSNKRHAEIMLWSFDVGVHIEHALRSADQEISGAFYSTVEYNYYSRRNALVNGQLVEQPDAVYDSDLVDLEEYYSAPYVRPTFNANWW